MHRGFEHVYDRGHARQALRLLAGVERQTGRRLARSLRLDADRYATAVLGSKSFAPWLYLYAAMAGEFREGWIPDNFYGRIVCPNINHSIRHVADLKTFARVMFRTDAFPDAAYLIGGRYYDLNHQCVDMARAASLIFVESDSVVLKSDTSRQGVGVVDVSRDRFDPAEIAGRYPNAVFQRLITQHEFFERFSPNSSTTLRVTTVRTPSGANEARAAYARFACGGDTFLRSARSVRVALDLTSGRMARSGYTYDWVRVDRHPDSSAEFGGEIVPGFEAAVRTCVGLHASAPHVGAIGWDVMVDRDERVWVLEWNGKHNDIKFSEATSGPCFAGLGWEQLRPVARSWLI